MDLPGGEKRDIRSTEERPRDLEQAAQERQASIDSEVISGKEWQDPFASIRKAKVDPYLVVKYSPIPPKIFRFTELQRVLEFIEGNQSRKELAELCWELDGSENSSMKKNTWLTYVKVWMKRCGQKMTKKTVPAAWNRVKKFNDQLPSLAIPETYNTIIGIQLKRILDEFDELNAPGGANAKDRDRKNDQLDKRIYLLDRLLGSASKVHIDLEKIRGHFYRWSSNTKQDGEPSKVDVVAGILEKYQENMTPRTRDVLNSPESRRRILSVIEHLKSGATGQMAQVFKKQEEKIRELELESPSKGRQDIVIEAARETAKEMGAD